LESPGLRLPGPFWVGYTSAIPHRKPHHIERAANTPKSVHQISPIPDISLFPQLSNPPPPPSCRPWDIALAKTVRIDPLDQLLADAPSTLAKLPDSTLAPIPSSSRRASHHSRLVGIVLALDASEGAGAVELELIITRHGGNDVGAVIILDDCGCAVEETLLADGLSLHHGHEQPKGRGPKGELHRDIFCWGWVVGSWGG
jgi:hypothetical protein